MCPRVTTPIMITLHSRYHTYDSINEANTILMVALLK
uniref:Uncharacterized protein MANES_06G125800 n=1 Tax=Rhizophora mucronata TaxID=61149 RepID=A0A2P2LBN3_RHIMU